MALCIHKVLFCTSVTETSIIRNKVNADNTL